MKFFLRIISVVVAFSALSTALAAPVNASTGNADWLYEYGSASGESTVLARFLGVTISTGATACWTIDDKPIQSPYTVGFFNSYDAETIYGSQIDVSTGCHTLDESILNPYVAITIDSTSVPDGIHNIGLQVNDPVHGRYSLDPLRLVFFNNFPTCNFTGLKDESVVTEVTPVSFNCSYNSNFVKGEQYITATNVVLFSRAKKSQFYVAPGQMGNSRILIDQSWTFMGIKADTTYEVNFYSSGDATFWIHYDLNETNPKALNSPIKGTVSIRNSKASSAKPLPDLRFQISENGKTIKKVTSGANGVAKFEISRSIWDAATSICFSNRDPINNWSYNNFPYSFYWQDVCVEVKPKKLKNVELIVYREDKNTVKYRALGSAKNWLDARLNGETGKYCNFVVERFQGGKWKVITRSSQPKFTIDSGETIDFISGSVESKKKIKLRARYATCKYPVIEDATTVKYTKKRMWVCTGYYTVQCSWENVKVPTYKWKTKKKWVTLKGTAGVVKSSK